MKQNFTHITDDLLVKYLTEETTAIENQEVERWIAASPLHQRRFEQFKYIWDESLQLAAQSTIDEETAWLKFKERVNNKDIPTTPVVKMQSFKWLRIAATIVLVAGVSWLFYTINQKGRGSASLVTVSLQPNARAITDTLPDGSMVTLNEASTIRYPATFKRNERTVELKGEAFFSVSPDKKSPFVITAGDVTIQVVGTSFNVKQRNNFTEVIVESGIVRVTHGTGILELHKGEKVLIRNTDALLKKDSVNNHLYNYYRSKKFVCDATPLWQLTQILEEAYHVKIIIKKAGVANQPLTTTFENESLHNILSVISGTFNVTVIQNGSEIVLQ